jgi:hypothetical protein
MNLGRVLRVSWVRVCEGRVDQTGSMTSLARGCGLGIPICAYLWRVTRDEVDGGAVFSTGLSFSPNMWRCLVWSPLGPVISRIGT